MSTEKEWKSVRDFCKHFPGSPWCQEPEPDFNPDFLLLLRVGLLKTIITLCKKYSESLLHTQRDVIMDTILSDAVLIIPDNEETLSALNDRFNEYLGENPDPETDGFLLIMADSLRDQGNLEEATLIYDHIHLSKARYFRKSQDVTHLRLMRDAIHRNINVLRTLEREEEVRSLEERAKTLTLILEG